MTQRKTGIASTALFQRWEKACADENGLELELSSIAFEFCLF
jgi:hypothetical protein